MKDRHPFAGSWPAFKLAWIKQNAPQAYAAARTFLTPKDYINFKLTGEQRIKDRLLRSLLQLHV
jgi:sugar (pentulose or hexulose) kinase